MTISNILLGVLVLLLIGALPRWHHSMAWGYGPSGWICAAIGLVVVLTWQGRI